MPVGSPAAPERRCVACGRRAAQRELLRVHLDFGQTPPRAVADPEGPRTGRGAYLCPRRACLDQALRRRAFQRSFRRTVNVDEQGLLALIEQWAHDYKR